ncbi:MAG: hypothetical protein ABI402_01245 [Ferruginibacter sp.]
MSLKKHIPFDYKRIAVFIFIFLNCFLTAAPFVNACAENIRYAKASGFLSQHYNIENPEDNSRSEFSVEQQEYHISVRSKQSVVQLSNTTAHYTASLNTYIHDRASNHSFTSPFFLVRPAYYAFLSLYKLF